MIPIQECLRKLWNTCLAIAGINPRATINIGRDYRGLFLKAPIIFKIYPFVRVKDLIKLDPCVIEELYIDEKFLSYNVYFDPKIKKSRWQAIHLFNKEKILKWKLI